ncbi:MAG: copper amine oxidase N-terminal domain-containing protein [Planctomycetes bacterium]|nr:copper amine oxidase N-terminal domain-containing protein [Planctomycetota bacterium]
MAVSIVNDTLYVPLAGISQALGLACTGSGDSFTLATPAGTVAMRLDSNAYIVNGRKIYLEVSPLEHDGEVLLPAYSLLDLMGIPVTWSTVGTIIIGRAVPMP